MDCRERACPSIANGANKKLESFRKIATCNRIVSYISYDISEVTLYPRVPEIPYIPETSGIPETISWNGNWALSCEFKGNDLKNVESSGEECGGICANNPQCTHFTWNYGTCWLKKYNGVSRDDAVRVRDTSFTCGIIRNRV